MSFFERSLMGKKIDSVHADSEVTYLMLCDGTQVTIRGLVVIEPRQSILHPPDAVQAAPPRQHPNRRN